MGELSVNAVLDVLYEADLFAGLGEPELRALLASGKIVRFEAGAALLTAGELNSRAMILLEGWVVVSREDRGLSEEIARLGPGACLGEMSALTRKPAALTVRALSPVQVLSLDSEVLIDQLGHSPRLGTNLALMIIERLQGHLERRSAMTSLLTLAGSDPDTQAALQRLIESLVPLSHRTVVIDLCGIPGGDAWHSLPPVARLPADPLWAAAVQRELSNAANGSWVLPVAATAGLEMATGVVGLVAHHCDQLLVVADVAQSRALIAHGAERFRRHVLVQHVKAELGPFKPGAERRVLLLGTEAPRTVAAAQSLDLRKGAKVYGDRGGGARGLGALGRDLAGVRIGLALGAGAWRGFAHIGVLERLAERGLPIDALAGSSAGAGIGGLWSLGYDPDRIDRLFADLQRHAAGWTVPTRSLLDGAPLERHLRACAAGNGFGDMLWPFGAVAVDLYNAREELLTDGDLARCVLASCAIPGIYPPVKLGGRWYVDGGVLRPVPAEFVRRLGADYVIAVDLAGSAPLQVPPHGPYLLDVLRLSANLMNARLNEHDRAGANLLLRPRATNGQLPGVRDYAKAREWRGLGREAVDVAWPEICARLPWLAPGHHGSPSG